MTQRHEPDSNRKVALLEEALEAQKERVETLTEEKITLQEKIGEARRQSGERKEQLDRLADKHRETLELLEAAREQLSTLREEVEKLTSPPNNFGTILNINEDGSVDVLTGSRKLRVDLQPEIHTSSLDVGQEVLLNEAYNVIGVRETPVTGEIAVVKDKMADGRVLVLIHQNDELVVELADSMTGVFFRVGDHVRLNTATGLIYEKIERPEVEELVLEEVPDISYEQIGGLGEQVEEIRDAVELPYLHRDLFAEYELDPPKGILLYGPPGCGKTLIAKAVATSLAEKAREATGKEDICSYFLNIKGPELLNKWVGETERQIRLIFQRAKEKSEAGMPVIVFFDEMDSLFRTRGSGVSSDIESTIVPQLLAELDGVESLENVLVIGASNREDRIDPAVLRPGRLDVKIKINRPDADAAREIFPIYLTGDVPLDKRETDHYGGPEELISEMIRQATDAMYAKTPGNEFIQVTYQNGDQEKLHFGDFASGAMIENIVRRAKKTAIKRQIALGDSGLRVQDLLDAIRQEYHEQEDLPNTTNPDDWAQISGKKGEQIAQVRVLLEDGEIKEIADVSGGQYL